MNKSPKTPDTPPTIDSIGGGRLLIPRTWSRGWANGIDTARSAAAHLGRALGDAKDSLRQAWGRLRAWRVWAWSGWRFTWGLFFGSGLAKLLLLTLAVVIAIHIGDRAYRNLQLHYQTQMLRAVADADVIHDICRQRSDIFWEDCATPSERGEMSKRFVWAMLVSADVIDPLSVPLPTQTQFDQLIGSDAGAAVVATWLRNQDRARLTGVPLLIAVSEFCESSDGDAIKAPALKAIVAASLADIYEPLSGGEDWLKPEIFRAMSLTPPAWIAAHEPAQPGGTWPAPADLRGAMGGSGATVLDERRAKAWPALVGATNAAASEPDAIGTLLGDSIDRRAVPDHIGDADVVATLFALGGLINRDTDAFRQSFEDCALNDLTQGLTEDQTEAMVANLEKLALYVAGQIRTSPEVKRARFWLSIYTGHEQRLIFIIAAFGVIVVLSRIAVFSASNLRAAVSKWPAALLPFGTRPVIATQRDNEFDRLASSRWPIRIAVAILPAIGFIGTVRGIMLSLSGADAIVWAETVNQRSAAISALSADLGLAFATTLLALMFGALLTILVAIEMALGERLLLRRYANPKTESARDG